MYELTNTIGFSTNDDYAPNLEFPNNSVNTLEMMIHESSESSYANYYGRAGVILNNNDTLSELKTYFNFKDGDDNSTTVSSSYGLQNIKNLRARFARISITTHYITEQQMLPDSQDISITIDNVSNVDISFALFNGSNSDISGELTDQTNSVFNQTSIGKGITKIKYTIDPDQTPIGDFKVGFELSNIEAGKYIYETLSGDITKILTSTGINETCLLYTSDAADE